MSKQNKLSPATEKNQNSKKDRRAHPRFRCRIPVPVLKDKPLEFFNVSIRNFSESGFYFETSYPVVSGTFVRVAMDNDSVGSGALISRQARIKWRMALGREKAHQYGCGAQYLPAGSSDMDS
ncbi:PilZ domain-containing protein [Desulfosudis oleivorans]|uniref:PilZ domain-containing protein n=1 Tax=Desulfosudis oleivorans TaxID=181663 RepID=UPI00059D5CF4|nr:PilZ domain-containing protein [Desulfosudis oleivorans]